MCGTTQNTLEEISQNMKGSHLLFQPIVILIGFPRLLTLYALSATNRIEVLFIFRVDITIICLTFEIGHMM